MTTGSSRGFPMVKGTPIKRPDLIFLILGVCFLLLPGCEDSMHQCTRRDKEGNLKFTVPCNGKGVYMGEYLEYHKTGRLWKRKFFVNGLEEDTTRLFFYQTGNVLRETPMKHGEKHGVARTFKKNGEVEELVTYVEGLQEGPMTFFYENGMPKETFTYQEDRMSGPYYFFAPDSTVILEGEYHNGVKYGEWSHYDYDGSLLATINFYNNQKDGSFAVFRENKQPYVRGEFVKGMLSGEIRYFNSSGKVSHTETWKNGRPASGSILTRMPGSGKAIFRQPDAAIYIMPDTVWVNQY